MAEENLRIGIDGSGAVTGSRQVRKSLDEIRNAATNSEKGIKNLDQQMKRTADTSSLLRRALGGLGIGLLAHELYDLVNTFDEMTNRLRLVTTGTAELHAVQEQLFDISQRTRSSFEDNASIFNRFALATKDLGLSLKDVLSFTENLNKAVLISGASATEASAGMIQLSQGLASGALRGDELRSVLEQLPAVADVIAKELGVTRGQLRSLGAEGKITADVVTTAFKNAGEDLDKQFNQTVVTMGQAFGVLHNSVIKFVGDLNQSSGVSAVFSKAIIFLANNVENLARGIGALAVAAGPLVLGRALKFSLDLLESMALVIRTNPIGLLVTGLSLGVGALVAFGDKLKVTEDDLTTWRDVAVATFEYARDRVKALVDFFSNSFSPVVQESINFVQQKFGQLGVTLNDVLSFSKTVVNKMIGIWVGFGRALGVVFSGVGDLVGRGIASIVDYATPIIKGVVAFGQRALESVARFASKIIGFIRGTALELADALNDTDLIGNLADLPIVSDFSEIGTEAKDAFLSALDEDYVGKIGDVLLPAIDEIMGRAGEIARSRLQSEAASLESVDLTKSRGGGAAGGRTKELQDLIDKTRNPLEELQKRLTEIDTLVAKATEKGDSLAIEAGARAATDAMNKFAEAVGGVDPTGIEEMKTKIKELQVQLDTLNADDTGFSELSLGIKNANDALLDLQLNALGLDSLKTIMDDAIPPAQRYKQVVEELNVLLADNPEQLAAAIDNAKNKILGLGDLFKNFQKSAAEGLQRTLADYLFDPFEEGVKGMVRSFAEALRRMAAEALSNLILQQFFSAFAGGTGGFAQFAQFGLQALGSGGGGGFRGAQFGNAAFAGQPMVVGESHKPELFVPSSFGRVMTTQQAQQAVSPNVTVTPAPVVIVDDPKKAVAAMQTREGQDATVANIRANREAIRRELA